MAANEQMTPNFAISDGWKLTKPKSSQRVAPPLSVPMNGTRTSRPMDTARIRSDSF